MNMQVGNQPGIVGNIGIPQGGQGVGNPVVNIVGHVANFAKQSFEFCLKHSGKIGTALLPLGFVSNPVAATGGIIVGGTLLACKAISFFNTGTILQPNLNQIAPMPNIATATLAINGNNVNLIDLLGMNNPLNNQELQTLTAFVSGAHIVFGNPPPPVAVPPQALVGGNGLVVNSGNGPDLTSHYNNRQGHRLDGQIQVGQTNKSTAILIGQTDDGRTYVQLEGHGTHGLLNSIGHGLDYITHVNNDYLQIGPMGSCPYSEKQGTQIVL